MTTRRTEEVGTLSHDGSGHETGDPKRIQRGGKIGSPEPIAALNRVRILEAKLPFERHEALTDIRIACPGVEISTERVCPYLRIQAAEMLNRAQSLLPEGYRLRVGTALRTLTMQKSGWDNFFQKQKEEHPTWPLSALRRATNHFFAPYDQPAPPGHTTGGAVDVALLGPDGEALDLIAPTKGWEAAYTWSEKISPETKRNRMLMVEAMLNAGFSNCRDEYWHYSFGDSAWAVRVGEKTCPYGWAHPPARLEKDFPNSSVGSLEMRSERDPKSGRVLKAEGEFSLPSDAPVDEKGIPYLRVGVFWAKEIPVALRLEWKSSLPTPEFHLGNNVNEWETLTEFDRLGDEILFNFIPRSDRVYLSTIPRESLMPPTT